MADRVADQVEEDALDLLRVGPSPQLRLAQLGADLDALGAGLRLHRRDRLVNQHPQLHLANRPLDVAGLDPRELEEVVDQACSAS